MTFPLPPDPTGTILGRRTFLRGAALALAGAPLGRLAGQPPAGPETTAAGLIVRSREPQNLEFPVGRLDRVITPNELFYVRNHFPAPTVDAAAWRLKVEGHVARPVELTLEAIRKLPAVTLPATLECCGNNRADLSPKTKGVQWGPGAVSTAEWTGVPLGAVLEMAGIRPGAVEVVLEGADRGTVADPPSPGPIPFARSLPLAKALRPEVLLAHTMNGVPLPAAHGAPLRAVVAGWYGVASIKWLTRLIVTDRPFQGFYQTYDYSVWDRSIGVPQLRVVTGMEVKSLVSHPAPQEAVPAGKPYKIRGAAWAGEHTVTTVEVSTDGGQSWGAARLLGQATPFTWRLWEFDWNAPAVGPAKVLARATDDAGRTQPLTRDPDRKNYVINHLIPVAVEVRG
jgi:DMSO/TMAO reductase YedYZ molybdopterin-dependent catalytic subunit